MKTLLVVALMILVSSAGLSQSADLILKNATVWTVDPEKPTAEAVAVRNGRILAVGSNREIDPFSGPNTTIIDAKGKLLLPGFIDDHIHFMSGGFQLHNVDLRYAASEQDFARRIRERAEQFPDRWVTGGDWDHDNWPGGKLPTKELVDPFTPTTPVFVNRYDGHMALANSRALALAKITKDTPDPPGGTIVRDPNTGEPTGLLKDAAMDAVYRVMPDPTEDEMMEAARLALAEARRLGVTSIQDVSTPADTAMYHRLLNAGQLTARMNCRLPISLVESFIRKGMKAHTGDEWIRVGSLKAFADGSLGSSTALFFDKYVSEDTRGLATDVVQDGRLERWALAADKAGMQLSIHAIGDSANSLVLDLFQKIVRENPSWDRRFRIEHAQHIRPQDFDRFARLGVIASAQPYHAIDDGRWAEKRIGRERCATSYAFRSFLDHGVHLSFGSDWTVAPLSPLLGIYAAVTRRTTDNANPNGWFPDQKISVKEAIACYTINNAYAAYEENEKGSITPGKLADFVILSENILTIDPAQIERVTVERTIVAGKTVYLKPQ